jgi:type I restriction enzyme M protein
MAELQLGFENKLWEMADKLRGNIESSDVRVDLSYVLY